MGAGCTRRRAGCSASQRAGTSWGTGGRCCWSSWHRRTRLAYFLRLIPDWMRVAVEFRHPSWHCEKTFALLKEHRTAYCVMSGAGLPCMLRATTDFVYVRMHGPDHQHLYAGSYPDADLMWWADRAREWNLAGQDVFVYFNNDGDANAVRNARTLRALLDR